MAGRGTSTLASARRASGKSLPGAAAYEYFDFEPKAMAPRIKTLRDEGKREGVESLRGDHRDSNGTMGLASHH